MNDDEKKPLYQPVAAPEVWGPAEVGGPDEVDMLRARVRELETAIRTSISLMPHESYVSGTVSPLGSARSYFGEAMRTLRSVLLTDS